MNKGGSSNLNFRVDDTINKFNQLNLSSKEKGADFSNSSDNYWSLTELFGETLIKYYDDLFMPFLNGAKYKWTSQTCQLEYLEQADFESKDMEISNIYGGEMLLSFSYYFWEDDGELNKGIDYIKQIFIKDINNNDLFNFYSGNYVDDGILNGYIRILEVFHEYQIAK